MNIIQKLTLRHMKMSKKRTLVTIIGVIISVAMITAVATVGGSALDLLQHREMDNTGRWHVEYEDVYVKNLNKIGESSNTKSYMTVKKLGYSKLNDLENENKPFLYIEGYSRDNMENRSIDMISGRLPETSDEIVIPEHLEFIGGINYKVGDKISVNLGNRYQIEGNDKLDLDQSTPYSSEEEFYQEGETREYTVTGIMEEPRWEMYQSAGYTAVTCLDMEELTDNDTVDVFVELNKVTNSMFKKNLWGIDSKEIQKDDNGSYTVKVNASLLRLYGVTNDNEFNKMIQVLVITLLIIILIGSVSLIYNAFAISISERSKYLGMMSSVGATKSQKKSSVFFEGFVVGVISVPIGILSGTLGLGVTFKLINPMIKNILSTEYGLRLIVSWESMVLAIIFSVITIFISTYIPANRASKITPIEAIRQSNDIRIKSKTVKTSKFTRVFFGFEGELALKNLKRNKKRYRATVISLIISIVLFLSVSSYSYYLKKAFNVTRRNYNWDIEIDGGGESEYEEVLNEVKSQKSVKDYSLIYQIPRDFCIDNSEEYITEEYKDIYKKYYGELEQVETDDLSMGINIKALDDDSLKKYAEKTGADLYSLYDVKNPQGILISHYKAVFNMSIQEFKGLKLKAGDNLNISQEIYEENTGEYRLESLGEFKIAAVTDILPIGERYTGSLHGSVNFYVSKPVLDSIFEKNYVCGYFASDTPKLLSKEVDNVIEAHSEYKGYVIDNYKSNLEEKQMITLIEVFAYGFIVLITAICIANIFNTISTSVELRKRELAMLKSVGMTPKSFNKMMAFESLFYGIKSLIWGLPLGVMAMLFVCENVGNVYRTKYQFPVGNIIFAVSSIFVVVGLTMIYSSHKIKKENIIDVLKDET